MLKQQEGIMGREHSTPIATACEPDINIHSKHKGRTEEAPRISLEGLEERSNVPGEENLDMVRISAGFIAQIKRNGKIRNAYLQ